MGCLTVIVIFVYLAGGITFKTFVVAMLICIALMIGDDG